MIDLHETMDARQWAQEFCRINPNLLSEDIMIAWFANAIMCGWDHARGNPPLNGDHLQYRLDHLGE